MLPEYIIQVLESSPNGDVWRDIGEGPFESFTAADAFVAEEVGAPNVRICSVMPVRIYHPCPEE